MSKTFRLALSIVLIAFTGSVAGAGFSVFLSSGKPSIITLALAVLIGAAGAIMILSALLIFLRRITGLASGDYGLRLGIATSLGSLLILWYIPRALLERDPASHPDVQSIVSARLATPVVFILALTLSAFMAYLLFNENSWNLIERKIEPRKSALILALMMFFWLVIAIYLDISKHHNLYVLGSNTPIANQALRNFFSDEGFMYTSITQAFGSSLLGVHLNLIYVLIYPFYVLIPRYETIITIGTIFLCLGAIPVFLLARRHFNPVMSLLFAATYLFHPTIIGQPASQDMSELRFVAMPILFAFYFFERERFGLFMLFSLLAMTVREDISVFIVIFGVLALIRRRGLKWIIIPSLLGFSWFIVAVFYAIPFFNPKGIFARLAVYSPLGSNVKEIATTVLLRPWRIARLAFSSMNHLGFVVQLVESTGLIAPLFSIAFILAIPALGENLLHFASVDLVWYYAILLISTLFPAYILGTSRIQHLSKLFSRNGSKYITLSLIVLTLFSGVSMFYEWFSPTRLTPRPNIDDIKEILAAVPDDASVVMPSYMLDEAKPTQKVRAYYQIYFESLESEAQPREEYVIIDKTIVSAQETREGRQSLETLIEKYKYELLISRDNLSLFRLENLS